MTDQDEPALTSDVPGAELGRKAPSHRGLRIASAAGVVVGLTVGAGAVASAATGGSGASAPAASQGTGASSSGTMHGHCSAAAFGTVKSVGTDSFTVATPRGTTVRVDVSSTTTYRDRALGASSFADVKVGERVAVFGTETAGTVKATSVGIGKAGRGGHDGGLRPAAFGTVKSVGTDSFTVATLRGTTVIVDVSSTTTYRDREVASPTLANIKAGENVAVFGSETTGTVKATAVGIRQAGGRWGGRGHRWSGSSLAMNRR